jgi:hypothetical protein
MAASGMAGAGIASSSQAGMQPPEAVAPFVVFLCTDEAANINGYTFNVGGGAIHLMTDPTMIRTIHKDGVWTLDELYEVVPQSLAVGLVNPSPPQA